MIECLPAHIAEECWKKVRKTFDSGHGQALEYELDVTGGHKWFEGRTSPIVETDGSIHRILWIVRDVTNRKERDQEIKAALEEKEILLREIRHRVNNNMQLIISLLKLQARYISDPAAREIFRRSKNRIWAMSIIHEMLYQSDNLARIDFEKYIYCLVNHLFTQYAVRTEAIRTEIEIRNIWLDLDRAIPCGLIINEIISIFINRSLLEEKSTMVISIKMRQVEPEKLELTIDGYGVCSQEDIKSSSFGLELINILASQLGSRLEVNQGGNTVFRLSFRVPS